MRRAPIVLTATVLGTAGVLLFKPLPISSLEQTTTSAAGDGASTSTGDSSTSSGSSSSGSDSSSSSSSSSDSNTTSGDSSSSGSGSSSSGSGSSSAAKDGTYTGAAETVRFGTTQVKVTISGGKITEVTVLQENQDDQRSVQISESAFPTLRQEVLSKQTAAVDTVSGATYTSLQYEASLQSALDQAGFKAADGSTASTDVSNIQEQGGGPGGH